MAAHFAAVLLVDDSKFICWKQYRLQSNCDA